MKRDLASLNARFGVLYRVWLLGVLMLGSMVMVLSSTSINVALPAIMDEFAMGRPLAQWLADLGEGPALALWLDGVGNPHNFGAILRSAAHFDAAVLLPAGSELAVSGAAARVAEGGAEAVPLVRLPETRVALERLRLAGFALAATVVGGGDDLFAFDPPPRLVYIMGAEGEGMEPALATACDRRLSIPGSGAVESLNVAAATAVLLACWASRHPPWVVPAGKAPPAAM